MAKILLVIFLSLIVPETQAAFLMPEETLRNLPKFSVLVDMAPEPEIKITKTTIRTDVEVRLRKAGISIFSYKEAPSSAPYLHVSYTQSGAAFSIMLSLNQEVCLVSRPTSTTIATTWEANGTGTASRATYIRQAIKSLTNKFINDYLSVNPHTHRNSRYISEHFESHTRAGTQPKSREFLFLTMVIFR